MLKFVLIASIIIVIYIISVLISRKNRERIARNNELLKSVTDLSRGTESEHKLILYLLKNGIPATTIFHDLYVRKNGGGYSQIDVVVATKVGIVVFEVKDYGGWIFGSGTQNKWTQVLAYGKEKYQFYNPIIQNAGHIKALKSKLKQCADVPFYSVIVFYGSCIFRDVHSLPEEVKVIYPSNILEVFNDILEKNPPAKYTNKREVVRILKEAVENGADEKIREQHCQIIHQKFSNN